MSDLDEGLGIGNEGPTGGYWAGFSTTEDASLVFEQLGKRREEQF